MRIRSRQRTRRRSRSSRSATTWRSTRRRPWPSKSLPRRSRKRLQAIRRCIVARAIKILASALALTACSSMKVHTEYDKTINFRNYKTSAWLGRRPGPEQAAAARDPRIREAVVHGIDGNLTSRGLTKVAPDQSPDLLVAVHGWAVERIDVKTYGYAYAGHPYYYGAYPVMATPSVDVRQYRDGTMIIDLVDATTRQMVWRGTATDSFNPGAEAETAAKAVSKTLSEYPPPAQPN